MCACLWSQRFTRTQPGWLPAHYRSPPSMLATSLFDLGSHEKGVLTLLVPPAGAMTTYPTCLKFSARMPTACSPCRFVGFVFLDVLVFKGKQASFSSFSLAQYYPHRPASELIFSTRELGRASEARKAHAHSLARQSEPTGLCNKANGVTWNSLLFLVSLSSLSRACCATGASGWPGHVRTYSPAGLSCAPDSFSPSLPPSVPLSLPPPPPCPPPSL